MKVEGFDLIQASHCQPSNQSQKFINLICHIPVASIFRGVECFPRDFSDFFQMIGDSISMQIAFGCNFPDISVSFEVALKYGCIRCRFSDRVALIRQAFFLDTFPVF